MLNWFLKDFLISNRVSIASCCTQKHSHIGIQQGGKARMQGSRLLCIVITSWLRSFRTRMRLRGQKDGRGRTCCCCSRQPAKMIHFNANLDSATEIAPYKKGAEVAGRRLTAGGGRCTCCGKCTLLGVR